MQRMHDAATWRYVCLLRIQAEIKNPSSEITLSGRIFFTRQTLGCHSCACCTRKRWCDNWCNKQECLLSKVNRRKLLIDCIIQNFLTDVGERNGINRYSQYKSSDVWRYSIFLVILHPTFFSRRTLHRHFNGLCRN